MTEIIISKKATIEAEGVLNTKACKAVVNLTDKKIYTSILDAAKLSKLQPSCICRACSGKAKTAGGKKWCYASDIYEHLDDLFTESNSLRAEIVGLKAENAAFATEINRLRTEYDAEEVAKWKAVYDAQEAKRKAKEKRERLETELAQAARERETLEARMHAIVMEMEASDVELRELYKSKENVA